MAFEAEELQAVLSSEAFSEAPTMGRLLKYLGEHHFGEDRSSLNEYRIGVEALGRAADFDPSKNSAVRVEMHRLRTRLRKYYESEGADHTLRIMLTEGRYGLRFARVEEEAVAIPPEIEELKPPPLTAAPLPTPGDPEFALPQAAQEPLSASSFPEPRVSRRISPFGIATIAAVAVILAVVAWVAVASRSRARQQAGFTPAAAGAASAGLAVPSNSVLILAGNPNAQYIDRDGRAWGGDRYFSGGKAVALKLPYIQGSADPLIYQNGREGDFTYDIPLHSGLYELRLYFVETNFGPGTFTGRGESSRVFSVLLNDHPLLTSFDILSQAGGNFRAFSRVFKDIAPGSDGKIHLRFSRHFDEPLINAIEIEPQLGSGMNPIRMVMQDNSYVDHTGQQWSADQYAIGGLLATHQNPALEVADPHLYDGERFGHFTYQIPVAAGRYTIALHFTEAFFGSESLSHDSSARMFDIYANGTALLRNFSILEKARGPNRTVTETFHGIEPNAAGLIAISFVPDKDYPCVSAIEVTDEAN
jgi:hypothetical protein